MDWEARESRPKWKMGRERKEKRERASTGPKGGGGPTRLLRLDWAEKLFEIEFWIYLVAKLDEFKRFKRIFNPNQGLNFLINENLNFGSRIQIKQFWNLNQGLFGFQTKDFGSRRIEFNSGFWIQRMVQIFSKNGNLIRKVLKSVLEIKNRLWLRNEIWTKGLWVQWINKFRNV
jgi:hypothetical protein